MKIGIVCPYNIFSGGGVQECVLALAEGLKLRGHEVKIITPAPKGHRPKIDKDFILIGRGRNVKSLHSSMQVSVTADTEAIDAILAAEKFDILHFHEPWVPIVSRQLLSRSNSINIATFHAKLPETVMARTIERVITPYTKSVLKYLNTLTAVSPAAADYVTTITNQPVKIIPNGIDLAKYKAAHQNKTKDGRTILFIGRLEKRKGVEWLLDAFALLQNEEPNVHLVIAGNGPQRQKLEEQAQELGLKNIKFLGYVEEEAKLDLLASADLFCSPALYGESFGIVLLEAMATGVPTVAGDNPGYSAVLSGTGRLSLVNPKDSPNFARRLSLMLNDQALRETWREWAKAEITQYDYAQVIDQYEATYKSALQQK